MSPEVVTLAHGEGARLTRRLIRHEILTVLGNRHLESLADAATLPTVAGDLVFTTDAHVVTPIFFPGGDIGSLAVHGTLNDLAVCGAEPLYLSLALVIEEGFPLADLRRILRSVATATESAGVPVVTGDTKVVPRGAADGIFLMTSGIGRRREGITLGIERIQVGDALLVNGTLGDHGIAVLGSREGLFATEGLCSDSADLTGMIGELIAALGPELKFMRDPTRGGVAAVAHELVESRRLSLEIDEAALPVSPPVRAACELLGLEPIHIANEGKVLAVVADAAVERALQVLRGHPLGQAAACIGRVVEGDAGRVLMRGAFGPVRRLIEPTGAPLPRIC